MKFIENIKKISLVSIAIAVILGIVFIAFPSEVMTYLSLFLGIAMIVLGVTAVVSYIINRSSAFTLILGILTAILGIIVCTQYKTIISLMVIILGIFLLTSGLFNLFTSFKVIASSLIFGWVTLFLSVATSVLGVVAITRSGSFSEALVQLIGVSLIVYAVLDIIAFIQVKRIAKDVKNTVDAATAENIDTTGTIVEETDE